MPIITDTIDDLLWAACNKCFFGFRTSPTGPILTTTNHDDLIAELRYEDWEYNTTGEVYCPGHSITRHHATT